MPRANVTARKRPGPRPVEETQTMQGELTDPVLTISEVFEVQELADLAGLWARNGAGTQPDTIDRYHVLAKRFGIEPALLLYVCQRKLNEMPDGLPTSEDPNDLNVEN